MEGKPSISPGAAAGSPPGICTLHPKCPCGLLTAPRLREVLHGLIAGDGEKQIAIAMHIQRCTVHQYVSTIYRRLRVSGKAELLARVIASIEAGTDDDTVTNSHSVNPPFRGMDGFPINCDNPAR